MKHLFPACATLFVLMFSPNAQRATAQGQIPFDVLHSYPVYGYIPAAPLLKASDGNFYGTTQSGGAFNRGTVFRMTADGMVRVLYSFSGNRPQDPTAGSFPASGLVEGSDGNFYGTTHSGGTDFNGTVFRITPAGVLTTLHRFRGLEGNDAAEPSGTLIRATDGNVYGTGNSAVFRLTPEGTVTVLRFVMALVPWGVMQGADGALYGATSNGSPSDLGRIFRLTLAGALTILHDFTFDEGTRSAGPIIQATDGNFYGLGEGNPSSSTSPFGTIFRMTPDGALTVLHRFDGGAEGMRPRSGLFQASDGNLYGATTEGGAHGHGTYFKATLNGSVTLLNPVTGGADGSHLRGFVEAAPGVLYGTSALGGVVSFGGAIFRMTTGGALSGLHMFLGRNDGSVLPAPLLHASDGYLYGTTLTGGDRGLGTVFRTAGAGPPTVLHRFAGGMDGGTPLAGLVQAADGNLYGTTSNTIYRLDASAGVTTLHKFEDSPSAQPVYVNSLMRANDGNLYGTTFFGPHGTVFRMTLDGILTIVHDFVIDGEGGGLNPRGVIEGADGNFYGTTVSGGIGGQGTIFRMSPQGTMATLHRFTGETDGRYPAGLIQSADGSFYGTTREGGALNGGTIFKMSAAGELTTLHEFTGGTDGAIPAAPLVQTGDGNFHGTTTFGGALGHGTIFKMSPSGTLITQHAFSGTDGERPEAALLHAADGYLYGTTAGGGTDSGGGVIFRILNVPCTDTVGLTYTGGTLGLRFTLMSSTPARWSTWLVLGGSLINLWSIPIPAISPAVSFTVPFVGFPPVGPVSLISTLSTESYGTICADWQTISAGTAATNHVRDR